MQFINPKTDYAFKKIFGSSESKEILISFLNALIYEGNSIIEDLTIINPNLPPKIEGLKDTYLDVKATLNNRTIVIIEMQVLNVESFGKRVIFNAAKTYALQLQAGEGYIFLKPVIALTLTDFRMFRDRDPFLSRFVYREKSSGFLYPDNEIELVFVELPKFTKEITELETITDKWIYFIRSAPSLETIPENMEEIPELNRAFNIASRANLTREELENLERQEMFIRDQQGILQLGQREAREEGREEGREEEKRTIAQRLLPRFDDDAIAEIAGLNIEIVRELRKETDA